MKTLSLRVPDELDADLGAAAARKGVSKSFLIREALAELMARESTADRGSALAGMKDLVGCVEGPEDLSVNPDYLDDLGR
ncbi:MAG: ribbon-helix-helix protein, CopG family [Acidobacteriota bacterium]